MKSPRFGSDEDYSILRELGARYVEASDDAYWELKINKYTLHYLVFARPSMFPEEAVVQGVRYHDETDKIILKLLQASDPKYRVRHHSLGWEQHRRPAPKIGTCEPLIREMFMSLVDECRNTQIRDFMAPHLKAPGDHPMGAPVTCHIAALVVTGNFNELMDYQGSFERGFRRNFPPIVTKRMIDVAVSMSFDYVT